jgi:hypothetical protein
MDLLEFVGEMIIGILGFITEIRYDLRNRNDRGQFKRDSEKYVSRGTLYLRATTIMMNVCAL